MVTHSVEVAVDCRRRTGVAAVVALAPADAGTVLGGDVLGVYSVELVGCTTGSGAAPGVQVEELGL